MRNERWLNALFLKVRDLLSASNQINNHQKAVEELVYNSIDAGTTSIAVRVNIPNNTIQVIDNGHGISKLNFKIIGQNHTTSKFVDLSVLKSLPNKYGYHGQSLANIIHISKSVKIVSRQEHSEETWTKVFENGKEKEIKECITRPSKGTTVEIKGLLFNLSIQKQPNVNEVQNIKTFLEHLSLVHYNISISLRDDSKNEIIFKIHKNRDIYQTLSTLYNFKQSDVQELQVEKGQYKVKAYLGKRDNEIGRNFIFVNGLFIHNSSALHKIVNNNFNKFKKVDGAQKHKVKLQSLIKDNDNIQVKNQIPFYIIFLTCPYLDYEVINSATQSIIEFKEWNQVNKLLEKLIRFTFGDMYINHDSNIKKKQFVSNESIDTREQVKKIMDKIMGSHQKNTGINQMQNGVKGKHIKRKLKLKDIPELYDSEKNNSSVKLTEQNTDSSRNKNESINLVMNVNGIPTHNIKRTIQNRNLIEDETKDTNPKLPKKTSKTKDICSKIKSKNQGTINRKISNTVQKKAPKQSIVKTNGNKIVLMKKTAADRNNCNYLDSKNITKQNTGPSSNIISIDIVQNDNAIPIKNGKHIKRKLKLKDIPELYDSKKNNSSVKLTEQNTDSSRNKNESINLVMNVNGIPTHNIKRTIQNRKLIEDETKDKNPKLPKKTSKTKDICSKIKSKNQGTINRKISNTVQKKAPKQSIVKTNGNKIVLMKKTAADRNNCNYLDSKNITKQNTGPSSNIISIDIVQNDNAIPIKNGKQINKSKRYLVDSSRPKTHKVTKSKIKHIHNKKKHKDQSTKNKNTGNNIHIAPLKQKIVKKNAANIDLIKKVAACPDSVINGCTEIEKRRNDISDNVSLGKLQSLLNKAILNNIMQNYKAVPYIHKVNDVKYDNISIKPKIKVPCKDNGVTKKSFYSTYDLVQVVFKSQQDMLDTDSNVKLASCQENVENHNIVTETRNYPTQNQERNSVIQSSNKNSSTDLKVTFESHKYYNRNKTIPKPNHYYTNTKNKKISDAGISRLIKKPQTFISKQSRDNFIAPEMKHKIGKKKEINTKYGNYWKHQIKKLFKKTNELFDLKNKILRSSKLSYTIEFTEESNRNVMANVSNYSTMRVSNSNHRETNDCEVYISNHISINTNTYTVSKFKPKNHKEDPVLNISNYDDSHIDENRNESNLINAIRESVDNEVIGKNKNFIFISQDSMIIEPINVCETILKDSQEVLNDQYEMRLHNNQINTANYFSNTSNYSDGLQNCDPRPNSMIDSINQNLENGKILPNANNIKDVKNKCNETKQPEEILEVSHHFSLAINVESSNLGCEVPSTKTPLLQSRTENKTESNTNKILENPIQTQPSIANNNKEGFYLKNRLGFIPKGMSPLFENCQTKAVCDYKLNEDYFKDDMYNNFIQSVRNQAEVFEPKVQITKELISKDINKLTTKVNKDKAALKFDCQSLINANVLNQIDGKFVAAVIKGGSDKEDIDYLVLFDQHAVHERIRLESNLAEYFNNNEWKSVAVDKVTLKLSKDNILYLHNYRNKFAQLGLRWTVVNETEILINTIPEAILGKNPRQPDKVIIAVKNLILEEINVIKLQGGCVSMHPKSIMDLVSSEACRYAIKFGDKLIKADCVELIRKLSKCNTPFQCAHGRPVMAVIMDVTRNNDNYEVNRNKLHDFIKRRRM